MPARERSEDVWLWYTAVYEAIQEIPQGRVTSYGHIARLVGKPECPRQVGVCLKNLPAPSAVRSHSRPRFHSDNVPWQRVINAQGGISPRGPSGAEQQAIALRREGVEVSQDAMGQYRVPLGEYGWFPDMLPSEGGLAARGSSVEAEEQEEEGGEGGGEEQEEEEEHTEAEAHTRAPIETRR